MDEKTFNSKLQELIKEIAILPADQRKKVIPLVAETKQRHKEIKDNFSQLEQSLAELRIYLKYLLFDLEATTRERDKLREFLKDDNEPNQIDGQM